MPPKSVRTATGLVMLELAYPSSAYFLPPTLTPASPREGDVIGFEIPYGECDLFYGSPSAVPVAQNGGVLRVEVQSVHETNIAFCLFGAGVARYQTTSFLVGSYTLQIDRSYSTLFGPVVETIAAIPFTVAGTPQEAPIPATGVPAMIVLTLVLLFFSRDRLDHFARR